MTANSAPPSLKVCRYCSHEWVHTIGGFCPACHRFQTAVTVSGSSQALSVSPAVVADEVLVESVEGKCGCPKCGATFGKAFFSDGDTEHCMSCGVESWFEVRGAEVRAHQVNEEVQGSSLNDVLGSR